MRQRVRFTPENRRTTHAAIVMSVDLAKREDISAALGTVEWELIVADESHLLTGKRANPFFGMLADGRAKRGLMLTSLPTTEDYPHGVQVSRRTVSLQDVMDWQGQLVLKPIPDFEFVNYTRSGEELAVLKALENVAAKLSTVSPTFELQAKLLLRATSSSLYTAERFAWRLGKRIVHARNLAMHGLAPAKSEIGGLDDDESPVAADVALNGTAPLSPVALNTLSDVSSALEELLLKLEDTLGDSKLQALMQHLEQLKAETGQFHVCIWTQFLATIEYLATALEKLELPISRVIGSMPHDEKMQKVEQFEAQGGVLLATDAALTEGIDLLFVDECVHYDLPYDPRRLEQRVGRFLRLGRKKPFRSIIFLASDERLAEEKVLKKLTDASTP